MEFYYQTRVQCTGQNKMVSLTDIRKYWPNAHPEWKLVIRKKNGKTNFKEKEKVKTVLPGILQNVQVTKETCQLH